MKKTILILCSFLTAIAFTSYSCEQKHQTPPWVDPGGEIPEPEPVADKVKMLWLDAEANFSGNFATQDKIKTLLDKIVETGFNQIVVDVRPVQGDVLYKSDFMNPYSNVASRGYDYLQFFIDEARVRDLKVAVSMTIFTAGYIQPQSGPAWRDQNLGKLTCIQYKPDGSLLDIKEDTDKTGGGSFVFLNPAHPDVQKYVLNFIKEVVSKYDFDSFVLDYCRFPDGESDFSDFTRSKFADFLGKNGGGTITNWPGDVFTYNQNGSRKPGSYYKQWWEFRSMIIRDFVGRVRTEIKAIKPNVKLEYWAASWWNAIYANGQNWASTTYMPLNDPDVGFFGYGSWCSNTYNRTGFANELDVFQLGAYLSKIYGANDKESIEYAINRAKRIVGGACKIYGTIGIGNPDFDVEEATYYSLKETSGLMIFDIVHVINTDTKYDTWNKIKKGIDRAEAETEAR